MNRLIIVGNGFDLAHELKTSYCEFISDYLCNVFEYYYKNSYYSDELLELKFVSKNPASDIIIESPMSPQNACKTILELSKRTTRIRVTFTSPFIKTIIQKSHKYGWVDIENEFFDRLNSSRLPNSNQFEEEQVEKINVQFRYLKALLEKYLTKHQVDPKIFKSNQLVSDIFQKRIIGRSSKMNLGVRKVYLNFNYTNTLDFYKGSTPQSQGNIEPIDDEIIHIHGQLNSKDNPIVFGFGDEHNKHYIEWEDLRNDEVFRNIKSFAYFKTSNYHKLMKFLSEDYFQVYIVGHSCGLSDRTMFRQIFEHQNIDEVRIFYHQRDDGTNDYEDKTISLARHFINKAQMRLKIVPEPECIPLPQTKKAI